jgi:hypothetical protein
MMLRILNALSVSRLLTSFWKLLTPFKIIYCGTLGLLLFYIYSKKQKKETHKKYCIDNNIIRICRREAICNCISTYKQQNHKGKIIAYIPYYAYSGGCAIALACDKIIMNMNAILGPCDAQQYVNGVYYSISSIINTVEFKKNNQPIKEVWLTSYNNALLCKDRQLNYFNTLMKSGNFSEDVWKLIYKNFFNGERNHDEIFSA